MIAALGAGVNAGVWYAFSTFVMAGLRRLPGTGGMSAMQSINVTAVRPPFMIAFMGTAGMCVFLAVRAGFSLGETWGVLTLVAAGSFLVGTIGLTAAVNMPLNDRLAALDAEDATNGRTWTDYVRVWTRANHLRALSSLASSALFTAAVVV
ncbi:MAG: hypothetical protein JWO57_4029 [Pseudonocardiales bacterium]|nr:hypothetical protein [Pseudonocardiales bacterium]